MKDNKSGWQFPKALEIIKCKEGNKEFMKERPARRPFGNTVLICEYPIDDTAAEEPNAKLITWRLAKRAARDFLRVSFMPSAIVSAEEPRSALEMLTTAPTRFSAVDCPICGCQIRLADRAPRIDLPAITEQHDADAEETEGGEDED